ncbi:hypothetical protein ASC77_10940 [Nocardioides sp. Root1257]|uniref:hypothetical protein n=1 Tax=unclassified Nocardioides TaxID=2615069 RepID=UPI0006F6E1FF|nr:MULTISPECIES: hypothetical protein [unclassified Nocardioides]KQW49199.1 hypothetical protein ASC77_10940 [Nocardioides sp. Root1257]KRC48373.1 hypothetical protein ASE24_10945 [Nocardioides sp. Root224]
MSPRVQVGLLAAVAGLAAVPYAGRPLSPDEGGLLLLAGQWSPGSSLYGDYFVDRPPGLIALAALADAAGGGWAFRALGIVAVVAAVLLSGLLGRLAAPDRPAAPVLTAATAALLTVTPLFGGTVVNGELLGLPFLIGGSAAVVAASRSERWLPWAVLAGVLGAGGALVKQSLLDVFVLAIVLLVARRRWGALGAVAAGALVTVAVAVAGAALLGTAPGELWDAVVVFRHDAAAVIAASATGSTTTRLGGMLLALVATGAPLLAIALARRARGSWLWWPALAVLAWELFVVLGGGSYWLHYLMGLVPGLVLLTAAAAQRAAHPGRLVTAAYGVVATSTVAALVWVAVQPIARPEEPAVAWLDAHARPGDTAVVAFGGPNILQATGMSSPYPDLWSLPVRVHDPDLDDLSALLAGDGRPTWVVVAGTSLGSWGIDASVADGVLADHYDLRASTGDWTIYRAIHQGGE